MFLQLLINGLVVGSGYALIAVGHTIIFGMMKIVNFAHGELYMIGAFFTFSFVLLFNNYYIGFLVAMVICILIAIFSEKVLFHRLIDEDIMTTTLITIGISIFLMNIVQILWGANPRTIPQPFSEKPVIIGDIFITKPRIFIFFTAIVIIGVLHWFIKYTKTGKAFRATFQNRQAALLVGININYIYTLSYTIGATVAGAAGGLLGMIYVIEPTMGVAAVGKAFAIVITAGKKSIYGAIFIAYGLGVIESLGSGYISSQYKDVFAFIILILVLLFKPEGIFGKKGA